METSKKESAQRQIEVAIRLFNEGKLDCAITLAAAAEGMLPQTDNPHIFRSLMERASELRLDLQLNLVINWLKHGGPAETATIEEFEAVLVIARGITKFNAVYHQTCNPFQDFLQWARDGGHLPPRGRSANN